MPLLQVDNSFHTADIEHEKKSLTIFKLCLKLKFDNTETMYIEHFLDDTETALEIQKPF